MVPAHKSIGWITSIYLKFHSAGKSFDLAQYVCRAPTEQEKPKQALEHSCAAGQVNIENDMLTWFAMRSMYIFYSKYAYVVNFDLTDSSLLFLSLFMHKGKELEACPSS